jgi:hypothetical protein
MCFNVFLYGKTHVYYILHIKKTPSLTPCFKYQVGHPQKKNNRASMKLFSLFNKFTNYFYNFVVIFFIDHPPGNPFSKFDISV